MSDTPEYKAKVRPHGPMDDLPATPVTPDDEQAADDLSMEQASDPAHSADIEAGLVPDDVMAQRTPDDEVEPQPLTGEDGPVEAQGLQRGSGDGAEGSAGRAGPEASRSIARDGGS
jgi:hypothetical protein